MVMVRAIHVLPGAIRSALLDRGGGFAENKVMPIGDVFLGENQVVVVHPQYVVDEKQDRQAVLLTLAEWQQAVDELEELDDICAYDVAKAGPQVSIPFDQASRDFQPSPYL
jgi:hypothetical protein